MATLPELGLNRYLYKDNGDLPSAENATAQNTGGSNGAAGASGASSEPATSVAPGSIIQGSLLQSSPGDQRVQINPNNDSFEAFRDGQVVVRIDRDGIHADQIDILGVLQPQTFIGNVAANGVAILLPTGWTSQQDPIPFVTYTVTHNLGDGDNGNAVIVITPLDGGVGNAFGMIVSQGINSFSLAFVDDGGFVTYPGFSFALYRLVP